MRTWSLTLLEAKFGDRVLRSPVRKDNGEEAADALLLYDRRLVVFQIKGCHTPAKERFSLDNLAIGGGEFFERTGMNKAIDQLVTTVNLCRDGLISGLSEPWQRPDVPLQPVVVTYERIPQFPVIQSHLTGLMEPVRIDDYVRPPVLMGTDDIESIVSLPPEDNLWIVLTEYVQTGESSFFNFLAATRRSDMTILGDRRNSMLDSILTYLGLEEASQADCQ